MELINTFCETVKSWDKWSQYIFYALVIMFLGVMVERVILNIVRTVTKFLSVLLRGWPPAHLDAEGDWNHIHSTYKLREIRTKLRNMILRKDKCISPDQQCVIEQIVEDIKDY